MKKIPTRRPWLNGRWPLATTSQKNGGLSGLAFTWHVYMFVLPRVLPQCPRPLQVIMRPEAASPPFDTKRKLRQQVVIFTTCRIPKEA